MGNWWDQLVDTPKGTYLNPTGSERAKVDAYDQAQAPQREIGQWATDLTPPLSLKALYLARYAAQNELENRATGDNAPAGTGQISLSTFTPVGLMKAMLPAQPVVDRLNQKGDQFNTWVKSLSTPVQPAPDALPNPIRQTTLNQAPGWPARGGLMSLPAARYLQQQLNPNPMPAYQPPESIRGSS